MEPAPSGETRRKNDAKLGTRPHGGERHPAPNAPLTLDVSPHPSPLYRLHPAHDACKQEETSSDLARQVKGNAGANSIDGSAANESAGVYSQGLWEGITASLVAPLHLDCRSGALGMEGVRRFSRITKNNGQHAGVCALLRPADVCSPQQGLGQWGCPLHMSHPCARRA
jgi:hypothetical protein